MTWKDLEKRRARRAFKAEHYREVDRKWRAENVEKVRRNAAASYQKHNAAIRERKRLRDRALRLEVLNHYGGKCECCGETQFEFIVLDHIHGGGSKHRQELGLWGTAYYNWVKKNKYPGGYRVLCHNCNASFGHYGYCPHTKEVV